MDVADSFVIKNGAIASTGKTAHLWTKEVFGDFRIIFQVRQTAGGHKPCVIFFGTVPASNRPARGLAGIQFQPPNGGRWDYRPGKNNDGGSLFMRPVNPMYDTSKWHQCEVLSRATGNFRAACCPVVGDAPCTDAPEVLVFRDPTAGKRAPWGIQMHNNGLLDEFREIFVETDPTVDDLITRKK
jgi:hypothetical protein